MEMPEVVAVTVTLPVGDQVPVATAPVNGGGEGPPVQDSIQSCQQAHQGRSLTSEGDSRLRESELSHGRPSKGEYGQGAEHRVAVGWDQS